MEAWIPITIAAAFMQNLRSAMQKKLKERLATSGATFVRFCYALPFAFLYLAGLNLARGSGLPSPSPEFLLYCATGGLSQILATALLVYLFSFRNFTVGTTFSKTETVQTAIIGILLLGDPLSVGAAIAITVSLAGVMVISTARGGGGGLVGLAKNLTSKVALFGIASGGLFGLSAVSYRAAALSLESGDVVMRAAFTLATVLIMQTLAMGLYLRLREPGQLTRVAKSWRVSSLVGLSGMLASAGWFTAMTLQNAAYVRALGQVELVFTFIASHFFFGERTNGRETFGIALVVAGLLILLLA